MELKETGKVRPSTEVHRGQRGVIFVIRKDIKEVFGENLWDRFGHVHRMGQEEVDGIFEVERETDISSRTIGSDYIILGICVTVM